MCQISIVANGFCLRAKQNKQIKQIKSSLKDNNLAICYNFFR